MGINEKAFRALEAVAIKEVQEFDPRLRSEELKRMSRQINTILGIVGPIIAADAWDEGFDSGAYWSFTEERGWLPEADTTNPYSGRVRDSIESRPDENEE